MSALPDPAELAPSRDPAVYGRARVLSPTFWAMMGLCVLCILAGMAIVSFAPRLWPSRTAPTASPSAAAVEPAENAAPPAEAPANAAPAAPGQVADLDGRVRRLEGDQQRTMAAAAETLAAASLSQAAQGPGPFADDLLAAERVLPASADLIALRPLARSGAPTSAALAAELGDLAARASAAARKPGKDASVLDQILYAVSKIIDIRRVDGVGGGADAAIARAQQRADAGDLAGAAAALNRLPPAARAPLAAWLAQANARIAIDRHIAALRAAALADLAGAQRSAS